MKKADRLSKAADRAARIQRYERQESAMTSFIEACRAFMTREQWDRYYPEAQRAAGETFHIVRDLVFALAETKVPIAPKLRKAIENVILECELDRNHWTDLKHLNYDAYWRSKYGYASSNVDEKTISRPHSPSDPDG